MPDSDSAVMDSLDGLRRPPDFPENWKYPSLPWNTRRYPRAYPSGYPRVCMGIPIDTLGYSRLEQPKTEGGYGKQELFPLQVPIWDRAKHLIQCGAKQGRRQALSVVL